MLKRRANSANADNLAGTLVRSRGICQPASYWPQIRCSRQIQWMHIISRRYKQVRWDLNNAFSGCSAHHLYFTQHPIEWEVCVTLIIGAENYDRLKKAALQYKKIDYGEIMYELNKRKKNGFIQNEFIL